MSGVWAMGLFGMFDGSGGGGGLQNGGGWEGCLSCECVASWRGGEGPYHQNLRRMGNF